MIHESKLVMCLNLTKEEIQEVENLVIENLTIREAVLHVYYFINQSKNFKNVIISVGPSSSKGSFLILQRPKV